MTTAQIIGLSVASVASGTFVLLQVRMWRAIIARRRIQRMMDDLRRES